MELYRLAEVAKCINRINRIYTIFIIRRNDPCNCSVQLLIIGTPKQKIFYSMELLPRIKNEFENAEISEVRLYKEHIIYLIESIGNLNIMFFRKNSEVQEFINDTFKSKTLVNAGAIIETINT